MSLESYNLNSSESKSEKGPIYQKSLDIINKIDLKSLPPKISQRLQILTKIFALGAVLAVPTAEADSQSEREALEHFINSDSIVHQESNIISSGPGFESKNTIAQDVKYFNEYDAKLLEIDPTDIIKEEWNYRNKPTTSSKFEFNLNNGMSFEEAYKQLQQDSQLEGQDDLEPIPLINNIRQIGDFKSLYDTTLQIQRMYNLIEEGKVPQPQNRFMIDRHFSSESSILGAVQLSIKHLVLELSKIEGGKYQSQVNSITQELEQIDKFDPERVDKLVDVETQLIKILEAEFDKQEKSEQESQL